VNILIEEPTSRNPYQSTKIDCTVRPPGGSSCPARRCIHPWVLPRISSTKLHSNFSSYSTHLHPTVSICTHYTGLVHHSY